ncbi:MAG: hypothetical protein RLZ81_2361 [Pseudomonadota bacterium]|jgi:hydroxyethylthiazole kinase-like uncharacterized protein yjeF
MQQIDSDHGWPLHDVTRTRQIELAVADTLPPHSLMQRAGLAVARLALAKAPHARTIWIACGPGNNGGDGMLAAMHLQRWGKQAVVSWLGSVERAPPDAAAAHQEALRAGVAFSETAPEQFDLCIDALFGIGACSSARPADPRLCAWIARINRGDAPVLAVDLPSGLQADTGSVAADTVRADCTLSLLTLKPGLFTAHGRDATGEVWFDDLGASQGPMVAPARVQATAWLLGAAPPALRPHASHKGSYGDVTVIGGAPGMTGAALLAASGALHSGAGRVFVGLLDDGATAVDPSQPELMLRAVDALDVTNGVVVCGCGGGDAIRAHLPRLLSVARRLVIDADALNAIANDTTLQQLLTARQSRQRVTVLTPHPLEAARLLGSSSAAVQGDRLGAAHQLSQRFACTVVLKGSGTVIATPGELAAVNATGNARLATAGTGDVLAGMIGAELAGTQSAFAAACRAVHRHGRLADQWPPGPPLTASLLARL